MAHLRREVDSAPQRSFVDFLVPCHHTPLYSHLHNNVTAEIVTCLPSLKEGYQTEVAKFQQAPLPFLYERYYGIDHPKDPSEDCLSSYEELEMHHSDTRRDQLPTHIVLYRAMYERLRRQFFDVHYRKVLRICSLSLYRKCF